MTIAVAVLLFIYNILIALALVGLVALAPIFLLFGRRFLEGLFERLGFYPRAGTVCVEGARPLWIHAASVGEVRAAALLLHEIRKRRPDRKIILSTFTSTGNRIARTDGGADFVLFLPLDFWWIARRAIRKFDPSVLIVIETEIWPNILNEAFKRGIPVIMLSGRMSAAALKRYLLFKQFFCRAVGCFTAIGMQSAEDRERIMKLGACGDKISVVGNLKHGMTARGTRHRQANVGRRQPLLVVGSSHRGEEEIFIDVFRLLKERFAELQMVLAPRHPQRFGEIEKLLTQSGLSFDKKSLTNGNLDFKKEIMLLDTLGDLEEFYAAGDVVFVGGSLVNAGGHNLLEPARYRKPILFGPYMQNFAAIAADIKQVGGGLQVQGKTDLFNAISGLLNDPQKRKRMGEKAYLIAADDHGALESNLGLALRYLG